MPPISGPIWLISSIEACRFRSESGDHKGKMSTMSTTLMPSRVSARDPKGAAFMAKIEAAYNKAGFSPTEAQRINEAPIANLLAEFFEKHRSTKEFLSEEGPSHYDYPVRHEPLPILDQVDALKEFFPCLGVSLVRDFIKCELRRMTLPPDAECWFAVPRWNIFGATYGEAVACIIQILHAKRHSTADYRVCQTGSGFLRESERSVRAWETVKETQRGDILIVPLQLGMRHRTRSIRRARAVISDTPGEFALGAFAAGIVALTHPYRFHLGGELGIDCSGDEYDPNGDGKFTKSLALSIDGGDLGYYWRSVDAARPGFGTASGFIVY